MQTAVNTLEQPGFTLYWDDLREYLECFSDREIGHILRALYTALFEAGEPELRHAERLPFVHLKKSVLAQEQKYKETKAQNRLNGSRAGKKKTDVTPTDTDRTRAEAGAGDREPTQTQIQTQTQNINSSSVTPSSLGTAAGGGRVCDERFYPYGIKTVYPEAEATPEQRALFREFRKAYPKKNNMALAEPLFYKALESVSLETILEAVKTQWRTYDWHKEGGKYIPAPDKWLRDRCWEDEPAVYDDGYEIL